MSLVQLDRNANSASYRTLELGKLVVTIIVALALCGTPVFVNWTTEHFYVNTPTYLIFDLFTTIVADTVGLTLACWWVAQRLFSNAPLKVLWGRYLLRMICAGLMFLASVMAWGYVVGSYQVNYFQIHDHGLVMTILAGIVALIEAIPLWCLPGLLFAVLTINPTLGLFQSIWAALRIFLRTPWRTTLSGVFVIVILWACIKLYAFVPELSHSYFSDTPYLSYAAMWVVSARLFWPKGFVESVSFGHRLPYGDVKLL